MVYLLILYLIVTQNTSHKRQRHAPYFHDKISLRSHQNQKRDTSCLFFLYHNKYFFAVHLICLDISKGNCTFCSIRPNLPDSIHTLLYLHSLQCSRSLQVQCRCSLTAVYSSRNTIDSYSCPSALTIYEYQA